MNNYNRANHYDVITYPSNNFNDGWVKCLDTGVNLTQRQCVIEVAASLRHLYPHPPFPRGIY